MQVFFYIVDDIPTWFCARDLDDALDRAEARESSVDGGIWMATIPDNFVALERGYYAVSAPEFESVGAREIDGHLVWLEEHERACCRVEDIRDRLRLRRRW